MRPAALEALIARTTPVEALAENGMFRTAERLIDSGNVIVYERRPDQPGEFVTATVLKKSGAPYRACCGP